MYSRSQLITALSKQPKTADEFRLALESTSADGPAEFTKDQAVGVWYAVRSGKEYAAAISYIKAKSERYQHAYEQNRIEFSRQRADELRAAQYLRENPDATRADAMRFARSGDTQTMAGKRYELTRSETDEAMEFSRRANCSFDEAKAAIMQRYGREDQEAVTIHYGRSYGQVTYGRQDEPAKPRQTPRPKQTVGQRYQSRPGQRITFSRADEPKMMHVVADDVG